MILGLLKYHSSLVVMNLTTNEHLNIQKYSYLQDVNGMYDNPYNKQNPWLNLYHSLFPSNEVIYSRKSDDKTFV